MQWWRRKGAKTRHFGIIEMGGGGVAQMFHSFLSKIVDTDCVTFKGQESNGKIKI